MQDAQTRVALEKRDIEKIGPPESVERNLLDYLFGRIFLFNGVGAAMVTDLFFKNVVHCNAPDDENRPALKPTSTRREETTSDTRQLSSTTYPCFCLKQK